MHELILVVRMALAGFFLLSGLAKLRLGRAGLAEVVGDYSWVPGRARLTFGALLVAAELAAGTGLFMADARVPALAMSGLLVVFIAVIGLEVGRGARHGCGCLGSVARGRPVGWSLLIEDVVMLLGALIIVAEDGQAVPIELARTTQPVAVVLAAFGLVGLSLLWAQFDATRAAFGEWRIANAAAVAPYRSRDTGEAFDA